MGGTLVVTELFQSSTDRTGTMLRVPNEKYYFPIGASAQDPVRSKQKWQGNIRVLAFYVFIWVPWLSPSYSNLLLIKAELGLKKCVLKSTVFQLVHIHNTLLEKQSVAAQNGGQTNVFFSSTSL